MAPEVLKALTDKVEQMRADAAVQFQRIAQLQAQLDVALAELHRIKKQAKYEGPERRQTPREPHARPASRSIKDRAGSTSQRGLQHYPQLRGRVLRRVA